MCFATMTQACMLCSQTPLPASHRSPPWRNANDDDRWTAHNNSVTLSRPGGRMLNDCICGLKAPSPKRLSAWICTQVAPPHLETDGYAALSRFLDFCLWYLARTWQRGFGAVKA